MSRWAIIRKRVYADCAGMLWDNAAAHIMRTWKQIRCRELAAKFCLEMARAWAAQNI